jgi:hypothetical protein
MKSREEATLLVMYKCTLYTTQKHSVSEKVKQYKQAKQNPNPNPSNSNCYVILIPLPHLQAITQTKTVAKK